MKKPFARLRGQLISAGLLIASAMFLCLPLWAEQSDRLRLSLSTGVEYSSGEYGGSESIEEVYIPVTAVYQAERFSLRLTVPYLRVRAPRETVTVSSGGDSIIGTGPTTTPSGLGDVIAGGTYYDILSFPDAGVAVDFTGKVKFGTADKDKGLGSGENDYTVQTDVYKFFGGLTVLGTAGYSIRGEPDGLTLDNTWFYSAGSTYRFTPRTRGGLFFDFRESSLTGNESIREITVFCGYRLNRQWRVQTHLFTGLSDSSPDWGGGVSLRTSY
mgnify:CR=1 FL=1